MQWVEKYRPKSFEDFALDKFTLKLFENISKNNGENMTHILLNGASGIGKTSLSYCVAKRSKYLFREYNASDLRGVSTIEDILTFHVNTDKSRKKVIILDEADNITRKAQELIVSLMDTQNDNLIFIFTSNTVDNFIQPIIDRTICININYKMQNEIIRKRVKAILSSEGIQYEEDAIDSIIKDSGFDIRLIINKLELLSKHTQSQVISSKILILYNTNPSFFDIIFILKAMSDLKNDFDSVLETIESYKKIGLNPSDFVVFGIDILSKHYCSIQGEDAILPFLTDAKRITLLKYFHLYNFSSSSLALFSDIMFSKFLFSIYGTIRESNQEKLDRASIADYIIQDRK